MIFHGIAEPEQLSILRQVLADYCREHGVVGRAERDDIAERILIAFSRGAGTLMN